MQLGKHNTVTYQYASEVDISTLDDFAFVLEHLVSEERNVHSTIWLAGYPELVFAELWEFLEPLS